MEGKALLVRNLGPSDLRRDDPFVRAVVGYFARFAAESGPLAGSVQGYLAGGLAVPCHAGTRATGDIDMFFVGEEAMSYAIGNLSFAREPRRGVRECRRRAARGRPAAATRKAGPMTSWAETLQIDPRRRDREIVTARLLRPVLDGKSPDWGQILEPELLRRAASLVDLVQHLRGQTRGEAEQLAAIRAALGTLEARPFWPGERALPPGTDPTAERWAYSRGIDLARLRAALLRPVELLPGAS